MDWEQGEALRHFFEEQGWDFGDYDVERQVHDAKFKYLVPMFAAYSVIILLDSIVETQLFAYAEVAGRVHGSVFRPVEIRGHGLEPAAIYLKRVAAVDVKQDPAWEHLCHLEELRNIIAHGGGKPGESPEQHKKFERLVQAYPGKVALLDSPYNVNRDKGIWISMHLCRDFTREIEGFFKRLSEGTGLSHKGTRNAA
jgi:hypothetical protein